jgi:hypothetical protein
VCELIFLTYQNIKAPAQEKFELMREKFMLNFNFLIAVINRSDIWNV